jgi:hypothetical protein
MKRYLIDPIHWYFLVFFKDFAQEHFLNQYIFFLNKTNTIPMMKNLFVPIYQDQSSIGKAMGFIIRSIWITYGSIVSTIKIIPFLLVSVLVLVLPFLGILFILNTVI